MGTENGWLSAWDVERGAPRWTHRPHRERISRLELSLDGQLVATLSSDGQARVTRCATGAPLTGTMAHEGYATDVAIAPDSSQVAIARSDVRGDDFSLAVWRLVAQDPPNLLELGAPQGSEIHSAMAPDLDCVAVARRDGVALIDTRTGSERVIRTQGRAGCVALGHAGEVAVAEDGGQLSMYDGESSRLRWSVAVPKTVGVTVSYVQFSDAGLVAAHGDQGIGVWNGADGDLIYATSGIEGRVDYAEFDTTNRYLAVVSGEPPLERTLRVHDLEKGEVRLDGLPQRLFLQEHHFKLGGSSAPTGATSGRERTTRRGTPFSRSAAWSRTIAPLI